MPNTNCCVPLYHATSKRHTQLSWHALPIDPKLNKQPTVAISNDTLKVNSRGTSECGLHCQGERRTHDVNTRLRYSHVPFKKLISKLFCVSHTNECCIFAIARRRLLELTSDSLQSRENVTGAPSVTGCREHRSILPVRMCGFTAVTGTIITKLTLIQQANLTSLTHWIFNLRKPFYAVQQATF